MNKQLEFDFTKPKSSLESYTALLRSIERFEIEIKEALKYAEGTHSFDNIVEMIVQNKLFYMPLTYSFLLIQVLQHPQANHLHVFLAGGHLDEILNSQPKLEAMAKQFNCSAITLSGRKGWLGPLKHQGWRYSYQTLIKEVA